MRDRRHRYARRRTAGRSGGSRIRSDTRGGIPVTSMRAPEVSLSVVVPLADDPRQVAATFAALTASTLSRRRWELIVVASGQPEQAIEIAVHHAGAIVRLNDSWT